jgi:hypothetical protein
MADESPRPARPSLSLTLFVSREPAFLGAAEALVARAGEHAGCSSEDARRLGQAVRHAVGGLMEQAPDPQSPSNIEVAVLANGRLLRVDIACIRPDGATSVEEAFADHGRDALVRTLVDRVEFGRDGDRQYCRLTQQVRSGR